MAGAVLRPRAVPSPKGVPRLRVVPRPRLVPRPWVSDETECQCHGIAFVSLVPMSMKAALDACLLLDLQAPLAWGRGASIYVLRTT